MELFFRMGLPALALISLKRKPGAEFQVGSLVESPAFQHPMSRCSLRIEREFGFVLRKCGLAHHLFKAVFLASKCHLHRTGSSS